MRQFAIYLIFIGLQAITYFVVGFELAVIFLLSQALYYLIKLAAENETIEERWNRR